MILTKKDIPRSYEQAKRLLNGKDQVKISSNGWLFKDRGGATDCEVFHLKLHNTVIAKIYPDNSALLNHGGWESVTTQSWINQVLKGSKYCCSRRQGIHLVEHPISYKQPRIELPCMVNLSQV